MIPRRARPAGLLILTILVGCQALSRGRTQAVPATSRPPGVNVIVDDAPAGRTPITLRLARRADHVLRFEAPGYRPVEVHFTRKRPPLHETLMTSFLWAPAGGAAIGLPAYFIWNAIDEPPIEGELGRGLISIAAGALVGWAIGASIDAHSPSNWDLAPRTLFIEMERAGAPAAPLIIRAPGDGLRDLRWLRISLRQ